MRHWGWPFIRRSSPNCSRSSDDCKTWYAVKVPGVVGYKRAAVLDGSGCDPGILCGDRLSSAHPPNFSPPGTQVSVGRNHHEHAVNLVDIPTLLCTPVTAKGAFVEFGQGHEGDGQRVIRQMRPINAGEGIASHQVGDNIRVQQQAFHRLPRPKPSLRRSYIPRTNSSKSSSLAQRSAPAPKIL